MLCGVPVAVALILVSFVGVLYLRGGSVADALLRLEPFDFSAHWSFTAVPMFLLMGAIMHRSGVSASLFRAARLWLSGVPGGLAVATCFACAGFSAVSGSSQATAAAMGRLAVPEMRKAGYQDGISTGVVASAGTLGSMIPPSIAFIIYGIFAEISISRLFMAGILPGIMTALVYAAMIMARCRQDPTLAPQVELVREERKERWRALLGLWPLGVTILVIVGGMYTGLITATEAGASGALFSLFVAALRRNLTIWMLWEASKDALIGTAKIFFVAIGAILFTRFLALSGIANVLADLAVAWDVGPLTLFLLTALFLILLGMLLDPMGIMLLSLPIFLPLYQAANVDLIWFGVIIVKFVEIGLLTPPVGMNVFVVKSVVGNEISIETIFKGVGWFLVCEFVTVVLLYLFPQIALFLPSLMQ